MIKKKIHGITIISLIITIVILLILAGITITSMIESESFLNKISYIKEKHDNEIESEKISLVELDLKMSNTISKETLEYAIKEEMGENIKFDIEELGDNYFSIKFGDEEKKYFINSEGTISQKEFLYTKVEVGDFVDYNAGDEMTYTSLSQNNGYRDEKYTANNSIRWRVLSKRDGKIQLISEDIIKSDSEEGLTLYGKSGYLKGKTEINNICSIYGHGLGAESSRSVNANDIISLTCNMNEYNTAIEMYDTSKYKDGFDFFDENGNNKTSIVRNYQYYSMLYTIIKTDTIYFQLLFMNDKQYNTNTSIYWLGDQLFNGNNNGAWYSIAETYFDSNERYCINGRHTYKANGTSEARESYIRPIVNLKENLTTSGKNSLGEWQIDEL